ncbi:myosin-9 isoform X6 [Kryptolebias marmoratus]|uniref:myosin-9 isoform X6 n=1 Tax=Kryptolebias marmoratus TaxID=37003 RepID=UPI0018ACDBFA|nr:myosin-9 isoform X6 [Kryptolebias marmoratus]
MVEKRRRGSSSSPSSSPSSSSSSGAVTPRASDASSARARVTHSSGVLQVCRPRPSRRNPSGSEQPVSPPRSTAENRTGTGSRNRVKNQKQDRDQDQSPDFLRNEEELPVWVEKLRQLIEDKVQLLQAPSADSQQGLEPDDLLRFAALSRELTFHLQQLQNRTEQELRNIQTQLGEIEVRRQQLTFDLSDLQQQKKQIEDDVKRSSSLQTSTLRLCAGRELQAFIAERLVQSEKLLFQEQALSALRSLLTQDLLRYQEEAQKLTCFARSVLRRSGGEESAVGTGADRSMQGKNESKQETMDSEPDSNKQPDSPLEEDPPTPRATPVTQNPKYQLLMNSDPRSNGLSSREANGPTGGGSFGDNSPRLSRWETTRLGANHYRGSLESLASRDWDTGSDRAGVIDSPPRAFNSPYTTSMEYNPSYRMSEFKVQGRLSPATSELNLPAFNSRSTSPIGITTPSTASPRPRFSAYDSLMRRRTEVVNTQVAPVHYSVRSNTMGAPNRKDFIEELTKQLDTCQKRNQFLEAESVEMEKERNQIRFEMRALLVNNEDLLRTNTQLNNELKRTREQLIEMEKESHSVRENFRQMELEVKQAREMMLEANNQEYAFNFLQQSLKNKIQDAEENLEKQSQHAQSLAEKLWLAERKVEELELNSGTRDKKASELTSTIQRLEEELNEAMQASLQASTELNLQQKLREDAQIRVEELEEALLEKDQEVQKLQSLNLKLQGEVSGKLIDKERTLEEEIQLRERLQLQCKQAERTVEDLTMDLQTTNQAKEDLSKQLKLAQENLIDMETELEELHESEQRWAAKQKKAIEQNEQLQMKLLQEKELNDELEIEKSIVERQLRELRLEVDDLQSSRVQEDVVSRAESRVKELENALRTEERNKASLMNTVSKLERRINELSDQMEDEHRIANEQKELMSQRIRSLKRQLNEVEEEASRKEAQFRHTQRELAEERETSSRLQRQLLDQHLQSKRKDNLTIRQTLDNLRLDLSEEDDEEDEPPQEQPNSITKV